MADVTLSDAELDALQASLAADFAALIDALIAVPVVLFVPRDCDTCKGTGTDGDESLCPDCNGDYLYTYFPGVRGPCDEKAAGCFDFADECETQEEAARSAHRIAELYADAEREYQIKDMAEQQIAAALEQIASARVEHSALVVESQHGVPEGYTRSMHAAKERRHSLRVYVARNAKRIKALRDNPHAAHPDY